MIVQKFSSDDTGRDEWLEARRGGIGGTRAGNLFMKRGDGYKKGFWETIAERVAVPASEENPMDRGLRIEEEALVRYEKETGKKIDKTRRIHRHAAYPDIFYSPDGTEGVTADVEVKCLNSASHIEAFVTKRIPDEYFEQMLQGFVVNPKLKTRRMVFYDPRCPVDFFFIEMKREDVKDQIEISFELQKKALEAIDRIVNELIPM